MEGASRTVDHGELVRVVDAGELKPMEAVGDCFPGRARHDFDRTIYAVALRLFRSNGAIRALIGNSGVLKVVLRCDGAVWVTE